MTPTRSWKQLPDRACGFVTVKSVAQQDLLALHRVRAQLVKSRTALCNQLRGLLRERGVVVRTGAAALKRSLPAARKFKHDQRCERLAEVPGVGPLTATALVAAVGNAQRFKNGRELSAYLGLVPRQHSSGGKTLLLGITKRGDRYLRTLLIHGARSALRQCKDDARSGWARRIRAERGPNVAAVTLANKNARVLWALLTRGDRYRSDQGSRTTQFCAPALHPRETVDFLWLGLAAMSRD
jgi:transposase